MIGVSWPLWTWIVPMYLKGRWLNGLLDPIAALDGVPVGYHFFVLRNLLILTVLIATGAALWYLVRPTQDAGHLKRQRMALFSVLASGQLMGLTLLLFFPEYHFANLLVYGQIGCNDYVEGFSRHKFFQIKEGMPRSAVEALLGTGRQGTTIPGHENSLWMYSGDWSETAWRFWIRFDQDGKVEHSEAYFWWD